MTKYELESMYSEISMAIRDKKDKRLTNEETFEFILNCQKNLVLHLIKMEEKENGK